VTELETYLEQIRWVLHQQSLCITGLFPGQLAWRPSFPAANSAAAIVGHTVGVTRSFALGVVFGQPITRDRPSEFATVYADPAEATAALAALRDELAALSGESLELSQLVTPSAEAWGSQPGGPISLGGVLAETLRHAAIHLGELRFIRSLIDTNAPTAL
jgi:hypothetical protein